MAHFAELDNNNVVLRVVVVNNSDMTDEEGNEVESIGQQFCHNLYDGDWIQTSYNGKIRTRYAGIGYTYRADLDAFIAPQPYPSWILNQNTKNWEAPVPHPENDLMYEWDEATGNWNALTFEVTD
jgi:hypothetical protein